MRMQIGPSKEYIQHVGKPAIAGIVLAVLTMASFILFVIISLCCKCCNPKRGCCQRSQPLAYWRRLPYIAIVAICALIGLIGGAIVLKATPTFADRLDSLVKDQVAKVCSADVCRAAPHWWPLEPPRAQRTLTTAMLRAPVTLIRLESRSCAAASTTGARASVPYSSCRSLKPLAPAQVDEILAELGQLLALAKRAAEASGEDANLSSLQDILTSAQEIRLGKVEDARRDVKEYTDLVKSIGLAVGAGLLAVSLVGLAGAALLVRCLLCLPRNLLRCLHCVCLL